MLRDDDPTAELIHQRLAELQLLWQQIREETEKRHERLSEAHKAQQYYFDAAEAEAWMSEQELYMMSEEKAKVRISEPLNTDIQSNFNYTASVSKVVFEPWLMLLLFSG